jgi:hypothetical protein
MPLKSIKSLLVSFAVVAVIVLMMRSFNVGRIGTSRGKENAKTSNEITLRKASIVSPQPAKPPPPPPKAFASLDELYATYPEPVVSVPHAAWRPHSPPIVDILVRSWRGDGHWIIYLLRSVQKFVDPSTYRNIIVIYNTTNDAFFKSYLPYFKLPIKLIPVRDDPRWKDGINAGGYKAQLYSKMLAHSYSDADFYINLDSDCIIYKPVNISHFMDIDTGRVYVQRILFSDRDEHKRIWQRPTEYMLKFEVPYETMTRFPMTFPRDLYQNLLNHISANHRNESVLSIMQEMETTNEFTPLGAYLITKMPNRWMDLPPEKDNILVQSWSWGGFKPNVAAYYECLLQAPHYQDCKRME